ncbi:MAG TPA: SDR family oxidoreductase [Pseudonocardia sp.]|jgi:NAD(P)-dependent dehydrogenase (short-subunit alcohol dehydrogenase family)|uniref:SDR family oxidoreductase n=1 Tax=Pseudonocardia sp. TaxID=60912 RepID=UPI002B4B5F63|nr:SDR family oxidoreductase [Pseudonocardia sp.]HLU57416.1 SDR family oxidoreductase [Pseudonocardia sp.]
MTSTLPAPATGARSRRPVGTVLVTGAASGLGRAVARAVASAGGTPLLLDRVPVEADPRLGDAPSAVVDLADGRAGEAAIGRLIADAGGLDGVVTSAGTDRCGPLAEVPAAEWERVVAVNLLGTAAVIRAALPALTASRGRVVTVASTLGVRALPDASAYCASKFGVVGLTRALAAELAGTVGVTLLVPGGMATAFFDGRPEQYRPGPDAQLGDPAEVADAVLYALTRPDGCEVREMVVCASTEPSWP